MKNTILKYIFLLMILALSTISYFEKFKVDNHWRLGFYIVDSESMAPAVNKGDIVITKSFGINEVKIGDVLTFESPIEVNRNITHRFVEVDYSDGKPLYITQGDANTTTDPWYLPSDAIVGKMVFRVPLLGYAVTFIQSPIGLILFVILPVGYLLLREVDIIRKESIDIYKKRIRWIVKEGDKLLGSKVKSR